MMFEIVFCALLTIYIQMLAQTVGAVSGGLGEQAKVTLATGTDEAERGRHVGRGKPRMHDVKQLLCNRNNRMIDCSWLPPDYIHRMSRARLACAGKDLLHNSSRW